MDSKKGIKDLLTVGTSQFISQVLLGLFWLYLASILPKSDYGELGFFMSIVNVGAVISILGLSNTVVVYEVKKENIFPASFIVVLITSIITAIIAFLLYQNFAVSLLLMGHAMFVLILHGINGQKRYRTLSLYRFLRAVGTIIFSVILYHYIGIPGIFLGFFIATLFILKEVYVLLKGRKFEFSALKSKITFTVYSFINRLSTVFFFWGDKAIIGIIFGFSLLASYQLAGQYLLLLEGIPRSIMVYLIPQESEGRKNKKIKIFSIIVSVLIALVSIMVIPFAVNTMLPEYEDAILPIQILSLALVPLTISAIQQSEFWGMENSRIVLIGSIIQSGLYLIFIILLGTPFGLEGISIGLLIAVIVRTFFNLFAGKRLNP